MRRRAIGGPNTEEHLLKAQLVSKIDNILKRRCLKQTEAANLFNVTQPDVSKMPGGDFRQFSVGRLLRFLIALDQDVAIVINWTCPRFMKENTLMMAEGRPIGTHGVDTRLSRRKVLGAASVAAALATGANLSAQAPAGRGQEGGVEVVGAQRSMEY